MKINHSYIYFLLITSTFYAQATFVIDHLPENTPKNASIYISGDFENWTGGQEKYKLKSIDNTYLITIPKTTKTIRFKFTQGNWDIVESDKNGNNINDRNYTFKKKNDTVKLNIQNWSDSSLKKSTASKNVAVIAEDFYIPQLNRKRKIWLYLPPDYHTSQKKYPVIYMHDGQNLFDEKTSFSGEWQVDETLNKLFEEKGLGFIVIGINNGGDKRMNEYSPWKNSKYGGGEGDAYINFITKDLKPYVDKKYRTLSNKENTAIIGSSMGGLISHYAGLKYPKIYGKVGVFSPSFWFSRSSFDYTKKHSQINNTKIYFLIGDQEGKNVVKDMEKMTRLMKNNGFPFNNISEKIIPNGQHNEALWRDHFKEAVLWLFKK